MELDEPPYIDVERCYDCRLCIPACPFGALVTNDIRIVGNHWLNLEAKS
jgi:Fe-S-cluster-containing hydrogenase component 2